MTRTALIDSDIVAFKVAAAHEQTYDWEGNGDLAVTVDRDEALEDIHYAIEDIQDDVGADRVVVCLTDPDHNFRKELDPTYKHNRVGARKPELLQELKGILAESYSSFIRHGLEADDCMGILHTNESLKIGKGWGETVNVSEDKDMRTVPGLYYNPNRPEMGIIQVSEIDADRFHLWQTICGDQTDGYPGCKGVGPLSPYAQEIIGADREELWDIVLEAYASKGKTEADAILQARLARILRSPDWDYKASKPRLWCPLTLFGAYGETLK